MITVSISYTCKYQLKNNNNYVWTLCGKCVNLKTGRFIKQIYKSGCLGYIINGKFKSLTFLKTQLEKIKQDKCPF